MIVYFVQYFKGGSNIMSISLSKSELVVMQIIWNNSNGISISELHKQLAYKNWTLSTIQSFITRLISKKVIRIEYRKRKRIFYACISRNHLKIQSLKEFINQWYIDSPEEIIFDLTKLNLITNNSAKTKSINLI